MSRLRRPDEIGPLSLELKNVTDGRGFLPVHDHYGEPNFTLQTRVNEEIFGLCIHHSGSINDNPVGTANYHTSQGEHLTKDGRGCPTLQYSFVITQAESHPILAVEPEQITWSQAAPDDHWPGDENRHLLSICLLGNFTNRRFPSTSQVVRLLDLITQLQTIYSFGNEALFVHADFNKPECPGPNLTQLIRNHRDGGQARADWPVDTHAWQEKLGVPADNIFGPVTQHAVVAFQRANKMRPTGVLDPFTMLKIMKSKPL
jgi:hypothetical protein